MAALVGMVIPPRGGTYVARLPAVSMSQAMSNKGGTEASMAVPTMNYCNTHKDKHLQEPC